MFIKQSSSKLTDFDLVAAFPACFCYTLYNMEKDWRENCSNLAQLTDCFCNRYTVGNLPYTDVTFILSDGSKVEAHKFILALVSPVFENELFNDNWMESKKNEIVVEDDRGVFRELIASIYLYEGLPEMEEMSLWNLLYLTNKYLINHLTERVIKKLSSTVESEDESQNVSISALLKHFQKAKESIIGERLLPVIQREIEKNAASLIKSKEFLSLSQEEVSEIVNFPNLSISEGQVFKATVDWCNHNYGTTCEAEENFRNTFQNLIIHTNMTSKDFITNVNPASNFLDRELLKKITQRCFTNQSDRIHTRQLQIPLKKAEFPIKPSESEGTLKFPHFDVNIKFIKKTTGVTIFGTYILYKMSFTYR